MWKNVQYQQKILKSGTFRGRGGALSSTTDVVDIWASLNQRETHKTHTHTKHTKHTKHTHTHTHRHTNMKLFGPDTGRETPGKWFSFFSRARKSTKKHKHFGRDGVRDKQEPFLGQTGPLPGRNRDPSLGETGRSLFNYTVKLPFCPVCPWDGWGFVPGTIVPQGSSPVQSPKGPKIENFQSRLKFSISLENFNPDLQNFPQKIGPWWVARLKFSISLENFKILKFFNLWALRETFC